MNENETSKVVDCYDRGYKVVASYECLGLEERLHNICFGHAFSKACQYVITNEKVCKNLK
jgi:hypothetical protein